MVSAPLRSVFLFCPAQVKVGRSAAIESYGQHILFTGEIYRVMYLLWAWLLLNLEIKQSDTEYIALSIGSVQVKNADQAMPVPGVQKTLLQLLNGRYIKVKFIIICSFFFSWRSIQFSVHQYQLLNPHRMERVQHSNSISLHLIWSGRENENSLL